MFANSVVSEPNLVKTGPTTWVVVNAADAAAVANLAPRLYGELVKRLEAGSPFATLSGARVGEEFITRQGEVMASIMVLRTKEIYLHLITKTTDLGRLHLATRLAPYTYDVHLNETDYDAFMAAYSFPVIITPKSPAEEIAEELKHRYGEMGGRIDRALELVKQGVVEFPKYETAGNDAQCPPRRECKCPDAQHRAPRLDDVGCACKHGLAQHIAWLVEKQADQVGYRKLIDRIEMRRRETALPVWAARQRQSLEEYLG